MMRQQNSNMWTILCLFPEELALLYAAFLLLVDGVLLQAESGKVATNICSTIAAPEGFYTIENKDDEDEFIPVRKGNGDKERAAHITVKA
mmetsp:Transcript_30407/g.46019  ORF Transcript_30407/g.46019 Transcript_30407/m.46019 type:complete len:90 (-) Transcript_30407:432-701(-)